MNFGQLETQYGLPSGMLTAIRRVESGGKNALSDAGALGEFQFMPATAKAYGIDPLNPEQAASGAARMMSDLGKLYKGNWDAALAHYNGGSKAGRAVASGNEAPNSETRAYVPKVRASMSRSPSMTTDQAANVLGLGAQEAPAPDISAAASTLGLDTNIPKLTVLDKVTKGMRDPIDGGAQLLTNMLPEGVVKAGNRFNNWLADKTGLVGRLPEGGVDQQVREAEQAYQLSRLANGETGLDGYRIAGNFASPANFAIASRIPQAATLAGRVGVGALAGGATSSLAPVGEGDFATEKAKQIGIGMAAGGLLPVVTNSVARVISPNASRNPNVQLLKDSGVNPTVGQTLGGWVNRLEEKAQSLPLIGDAIMAARKGALNEFNETAINRAASKVGAKVDQIGQPGIKAAGDAISDFYEQALGKVGHVTFDGQFGNELAQLRSMAQGLTPDLAKKFEKALSDLVLSRTSPNGSMLGKTYKTVDSDLGGLASRYARSSVAAEQEFSDAVKQLQSVLHQQMRRSNPQVAGMLDQADSAWANLVRVEGASKAAKNTEGVFTPAQLNQAIQSADRSVRKRAVSRGTALMQDLGNAGQTVLGNKYPDSGTAGRLMLGGAGLATGLASPAIPMALASGSALYLPQVQKLLTKLVSERPEFAGLLADSVRKATPALLPGSGQLGLGLLDQ